MSHAKLIISTITNLREIPLTDHLSRQEVVYRRAHFTSFSAAILKIIPSMILEHNFLLLFNS